MPRREFSYASGPTALSLQKIRIPSHSIGIGRGVQPTELMPAKWGIFNRHNGEFYFGLDTVFMEIEFRPRPTFKQALDTLLAARWKPRLEDCILYNVEDESGWPDSFTRELHEWPQVRALLEARSSTGQTVGLAMLFAETGAGAGFQFTPQSLNVSPTFNPVRLENALGIADFSWYLPKVLVPFVSSGHAIVEVKCIDAEG